MHPAAIGPFTIERELGRGGMGEVYLARDTRLDRLVAIKALPEHLAQDPDRLVRFQREAKMLASLNHPGIGAIYGLEEFGGHQYLVLEFIEGETLAALLTKGPVPLDECLSLAKQIAEALEAAHEKGIVHRDLKPGNVMVTSDGVVKVLDFGLARTADGIPSSTIAPPSADSPTLTSPARFANSPTIPGVILGTAGYMSPEQARGKTVDKRSDIFSFGCVLYEMLTGTMPFRGETVADAIGATLHKESDLALLPPNTPQRVRDLLANCLAKDRRNRLHDIGDARLEIERALNGREWSAGTTSASVPKSRRFLAIGGACALVLIAGGGGWLLARGLAPKVPPAQNQSFHVSTSIPSKPTFNRLEGISPDSSFVLYTAWTDQEPDSETPSGVLMVRRLDRDETSAIEGTEGAWKAALSPDGRSIAFSCAKDRTQTKFSIKKVALENGRPIGKPQVVCDAGQAREVQVGWASDREIVFGGTVGVPVFAVSVSGGEPRVVVRPGSSSGIEGWEAFRPLVAGKNMLATHYSIASDKIRVNTEVIDLASGERTIVLTDAAWAQFAVDTTGGEPLLVAARSDMEGLIAVRFDIRALTTLGNPVPVWNGGTINDFALAKTGTLAIAPRPTEAKDRRLAWIDDKGQAQPISGARRAYSTLAISPDGARVLVGLEVPNPTDPSSELLVLDLERHTSTRIPITGFLNNGVWHPDGKRITYGVFAQEEFSIWDRPAIGSGEATKLLSRPMAQQRMARPSAWTPDGRSLAIEEGDIKAVGSDVLMLEREAEGEAWKPTPYLNSPAEEHALQFSRDGKWVLFCSAASGKHELYIQRFTTLGSAAEDAAKSRLQISTNGHSSSTGWWSADGSEIRYIDSDQQMVSVEVKTEPSLSASLPKPLYSLKDLKITGSAWAPDGRLMVILEGENEQKNKIDLVLNFLDEVSATLDAAK